MQIALGDLLLIALAVGAVWLWWKFNGAKELARATAKRHCQQLEVQLLDDTVALQKCWLRRNKLGNVCIWYCYIFEFSTTGEKRYQGIVTLLDKHIEEIQLETHHMPH